MKRAYTQFTSKIFKAYKEYKKHFGVSWLEMRNVFGIEKFKNTTDISEYEELSATLFDMWADFGEGKCRHVFLKSREFCDWIVSCVPELEIDHAAVFQEKIGGNNIVVEIHFPTDSKLNSCLFCVSKNPAAIVIDDGSFPEYVAFYDSLFLAHFEFLNDRQRKVYLIKLISGLGMYWSAFPEAVVNGVPSDLKHPSHHQHKSIITFEESPKIYLGGTHDSPSAHFRRGFFKVLKSPYFVNKRFQCIFVHETFVKGKAKTVLTPEEVK